MLWFVLALGTAVFESLKNVAVKRSLKDVNEFAATFAWRVWALAFTLPLLAFFGIPEIRESFWIALLVSGLINTLSLALIVRAFKHSDLSLVSPMVAFTPLFLLITSPFIIGEFPPVGGIAGVLAIVVGSYVINAREGVKGILAPFASLANERGARYMLVVAFLWSISSNFDKIGILNSSPAFWTVALNVFLAVSALVILLVKNERLTRKEIALFAPAGAFNAIMLTIQSIAVSMTLVSYVIAVKRLSIVLDVAFGHTLLNEKGAKQRLMGAIIMLIGVVLIALSV